MKKQILITAAFLMGLQVPVLAMEKVKVLPQAAAAEIKADRAASEAAAAAAPRVDVKRRQEMLWGFQRASTTASLENRGSPELDDLKMPGELEAERLAAAKREQAEIDTILAGYAAEVTGTTTFRHEDRTRTAHTLFNGKQVPVVIVRTDVDIAKYNRKKEKALQSQRAHRQNLVLQKAAQKDACYKSAALLGGVLLGCMYIHKHGILEYLAERHGPMSANMVQVMATLAVGAFANKAWQAGWNAWSTTPEKIKAMDEKIRVTESLRTPGRPVDQFVRMATDFPVEPQSPRRSRAAVSADGRGVGLGLGAGSAAPRPPVRYDVPGMENNPAESAGATAQ